MLSFNQFSREDSSKWSLGKCQSNAWMEQSNFNCNFSSVLVERMGRAIRKVVLENIGNLKNLSCFLNTGPNSHNSIRKGIWKPQCLETFRPTVTFAEKWDVCWKFITYPTAKNLSWKKNTFHSSEVRQRATGTECQRTVSRQVGRQVGRQGGEPLYQVSVQSL